MIPIEHNNHLLVEVPKGSNRFVIAETLHGWVIRCFHGKTESTWDNDIPIKPISYSIVGLAKELMEEQWKEIVYSDHYSTRFSRERKVAYKDYVDGLMMTDWTATASGLSLLKSHGLNPSTTLIIKKL